MGSRSSRAPTVRFRQCRTRRSPFATIRIPIQLKCRAINLPRRLSVRRFRARRSRGRFLPALLWPSARRRPGWGFRFGHRLQINPIESPFRQAGEVRFQFRFGDRRVALLQDERDQLPLGVGLRRDRAAHFALAGTGRGPDGAYLLRVHEHVDIGDRSFVAVESIVPAIANQPQIEPGDGRNVLTRAAANPRGRLPRRGPAAMPPEVLPARRQTWVGSRTARRPMSCRSSRRASPPDGSRVGIHAIARAKGQYLSFRALVDTSSDGRNTKGEWPCSSAQASASIRRHSARLSPS